MLGTYFTAIFGLSASAFIYWIGPRIYVHTRINPIKKDSLVAFTLCYSALITFFFDVCAYMSSGGSSTAGSLTLCALIWSPIFYHRNKKKLMRTRLLILPEPVPPLQWVPKQQPGNAEEAPPPADKQEEPEQPARPKIVTPVKLGSQPATSVAPCVAEAPQPLIVRKSSIWLKSFAVVMTVLFAAVMVYAVYLNFELENTQGELNKTNWLYKSLKPKYDTLKTDL